MSVCESLCMVPCGRLESFHECIPDFNLDFESFESITTLTIKKELLKMNDKLPQDTINMKIILVLKLVKNVCDLLPAVESYYNASFTYLQLECGAIVTLLALSVSDKGQNKVAYR